MSERPTKQVIVLRKDLNMRKGKMVAQGAHASMAVILDLQARFRDNEGQQWALPLPVGLWLGGDFTKICVGASSEEELRALVGAARAAGIPAALITDSGKTEFGGVPTVTACAIGPWWSDEVDKITGHLPLL